MTIKEDIKEIKEHISILNDEVGACENRLAKLETDLEWVKKGIWSMIIPLIINLIIALLRLIPLP